MLTTCWIQISIRMKDSTCSLHKTHYNKSGRYYTLPNSSWNHKLHNNQRLSRFLYFVFLKFPFVCVCVCVSDGTDRQGGHYYSNATFSWLSLIPFLARCHSKTECNQFPRANWRAINCAKGCIVASGAQRKEGELRAEGEEMAEQQVRHYSIPSQ